ncbi:MAG: hypothetical protein SFW66_05055 [Gammaproteobacteria bacterium]|nr:hypothetical protein [Gammaproteobacteria bacterium]
MSRRKRKHYKSTAHVTRQLLQTDPHSYPDFSFDPTKSNDYRPCFDVTRTINGTQETNHCQMKIATQNDGGDYDLVNYRQDARLALSQIDDAQFVSCASQGFWHASYTDTAYFPDSDGQYSSGGHIKIGIACASGLLALLPDLDRISEYEKPVDLTSSLAVLGIIFGSLAIVGGLVYMGCAASDEQNVSCFKKRR